MSEMNEKTIWSVRQNNPELVVRDCIEEFGFNEKQCEALRFILMKRGVNKWLFARRKFIKLKHEVKEMLKKVKPKSKEWWQLRHINERMQNIAKLPRWIEFPSTTTHNWKNIEAQIKIRGKHC